MFQIFLNRNNTIKLQLQNGNSGANLGNVDRITVTITIDDVVIDSDSVENETENYITWTSTIPSFNEANLILKLGKHPELEEYSGIREMRITVYDFDNPDGLVWIDEMTVNVVPDSV